MEKGDVDIETMIASRSSKFVLDTNTREKTPPGIIHPSSVFKTAWNIILLTLLVYTATIMPFRMAFLKSEMMSAWFFVELLVDILFILDVYVN
jgi:hypothetical protein